MVVKDRVGRNRYIAFRIEGRRRVTPPEFTEALRGAAASVPAPERPRLVLLAGDRGLVRCRHTAKEATIALLRAVTKAGGGPVRVETLGTSGTIRRARRKYLEPAVPEKRSE